MHGILGDPGVKPSIYNHYSKKLYCKNKVDSTLNFKDENQTESWKTSFSLFCKPQQRSVQLRYRVKKLLREN